MRKKLHPVHPGRVLLEEFLKPMGISQNKLAIRDCSEKKWEIAFKGQMKAGYKTLSLSFWP